MIIKFNSSEDLSENADSCVTNDRGFLFSLFSCALVSLNVFASFSLSNTTKSSPAFAAPFIPKISTGVDGRASSILCPLSLIIALTFPHFKPLTKKSPFLMFLMLQLYLLPVLYLYQFLILKQFQKLLSQNQFLNLKFQLEVI